MDADMVLLDGALRELAARACPDLILPGFRHHIKIEDHPGLATVGPDLERDPRVSQVVSPGRLPFSGTVLDHPTPCRLLDATDDLLQLGHGRWLLDWSVPPAVVTALVAMPRAAVVDVGGFHPGFYGLWGAEDAYLTAKLIAAGLRVAPVRTAVGFHLDPPESEAETRRKQAGLARTISFYRSLLEKPLPADGTTWFHERTDKLLDEALIVERILMALQGVRHFKEIAYAPGVSYGEVFGQAEYEMSRYYLDEADIAANRRLLEISAAEAQRLVDLRLPVPAYSYVLKCSHVFNVLDARGAVSTSERASEFARMRTLAGRVAALWVERRAELGHPLGISSTPSAPLPTAIQQAPAARRKAQPVLFEIGTEEMPPAEAGAARAEVHRRLTEALARTRLTHGAITVYATPRRLVATIDKVSAVEPDHERVVRGPKTVAGFAPDGTPTAAAAGFARANGREVSDLDRVEVDGIEHLAVRRVEAGRTVADALAEVLPTVVTGLRATKNMRWLDPQLTFTRPIRWLVALWGAQPIPVRAGGLLADRTTRTLRTSPSPAVTVRNVAAYAATMDQAGIILDVDERRVRVAVAAIELTGTIGGTVDVASESALLDQISYLVEAPNPLLGSYDPAYLELPDAVLVTVMRKHQRYLPVRSADGALLPFFVAVANGPVDADAVRAGNEAVLWARFEDAAYFYRADLATPVETMRERLSRLTFADRLGSMHDRANRISALADRLAGIAGLEAGDRATLDQARPLVKFDLASQMVTELTSLAGVMAHQYALAAGLPQRVAQALGEVELPRHAGDELPASQPGAILALADRLDFMVGLAATVGVPSGSSDPYAIRRAALGAIAILRRHPALERLSLADGLTAAAQLQPIEVPEAAVRDVAELMTRRLEQALTDEARPIQHVRAALRHADRPHRVDVTLAQLDALAGKPALARVAEAMQRTRKIAPVGTSTHYDPVSLTEPAELQLHRELGKSRTEASDHWELAQFVDVTENLAEAVAEFFEQVLVMTDDPATRATRLALLASVADLGSSVLNWDAIGTPA